jgi:TIR domain-containing protein
MRPERRSHGCPRVFVSHAREDKERFVLDFATKLRSQHDVDAWLDRWEMRPGDSLIQKIFDEGIGQAEAVIVIISEHSINKPWVRKELDVSTVRQIEDDIKLIPVVIGDVEKHQIPASLRDTLWVRIRNLAQYETELSEIVDGIHGRRERPPLGP